MSVTPAAPPAAAPVAPRDDREPGAAPPPAVPVAAPDAVDPQRRPRGPRQSPTSPAAALAPGAAPAVTPAAPVAPTTPPAAQPATPPPATDTPVQSAVRQVGAVFNNPWVQGAIAILTAIPGIGAIVGLAAGAVGLGLFATQWATGGKPDWMLLGGSLLYAAGGLLPGLMGMKALHSIGSIGGVLLTGTANRDAAREPYPHPAPGAQPAPRAPGAPQPGATPPPASATPAAPAPAAPPPAAATPAPPAPPASPPPPRRAAPAPAPTPAAPPSRPAPATPRAAPRTEPRQPARPPSTAPSAPAVTPAAPAPAAPPPAAATPAPPAEPTPAPPSTAREVELAAHADRAISFADVARGELDEAEWQRSIQALHAERSRLRAAGQRLSDSERDELVGLERFLGTELPEALRAAAAQEPQGVSPQELATQRQRYARLLALVPRVPPAPGE